MPEAGLVCRRCRTGLSRKGDSWCQFCSCASTLSELAKTRFAFPAHRAFAEELIYQTVRQVQCVVDLDKQTNSQVTSLSDRLGNANKKLNEVTCSINRSATPKRAPSRPEEADKVKSENKEPAERHEEEPPDFGSAESYEESSEEEIEPKETEVREEVERKEFQPALSGDAAPPEPLLGDTESVPGAATEDGEEDLSTPNVSEGCRIPLGLLQSPGSARGRSQATGPEEVSARHATTSDGW